MHDFACVTLVTSGSYREKHYGREYLCGPGTLLIKPAGAPHMNRYSRDGANSLILELIDPDFECLPQPAEPWCGNATPAMLLASRVCEEIELADPASPAIVDGLLRAILALAERDQRESAGGPPGWLRIVREHLHDDLRRPPRIRELAALAGVHPDTLSRVFKRHYGSAIGDYHRNVRVCAASEKLRTTTLSISQISLEVGFADQSHFTRAFKSTFGVPPARYRRLFGPTQNPVD